MPLFLLAPRQAARICHVCRQQRRNLSRDSRFASTYRTPHRAPTLTIGAQECTSNTQCISTTPTFAVSRTFASSSGSDNLNTSPEQSSKPDVPQTNYDFFPQTLPDGPPPKGDFVIDVRRLRREFLALQAGAHPDMHPQHMKSRAEATSARINEAFKTLESPLLRAQYILSLRGIDVANDETAKVEDPELLMLVLEVREAIEDAEEESDLDAMKAENEERIHESEAVLKEAFRDDDLEVAKREVTRLRYWINIRESINNWEKGKPVVLEH
ncbi:Co-chaperone Hsc20 [Xylariomycetidae sp. FL2044]|nr:Co-chaperone Hsc20 [Xylariomycetidae sp. FL2044]